MNSNEGRYISTPHAADGIKSQCINNLLWTFHLLLWVCICIRTNPPPPPDSMVIYRLPWADSYRILSILLIVTYIAAVITTILVLKWRERYLEQGSCRSNKKASTWE